MFQQKKVDLNFFSFNHCNPVLRYSKMKIVVRPTLLLNDGKVAELPLVFLALKESIPSSNSDGDVLHREYVKESIDVVGSRFGEIFACFTSTLVWGWNDAVWANFCAYKYLRPKGATFACAYKYWFHSTASLKIDCNNVVIILLYFERIRRT